MAILATTLFGSAPEWETNAFFCFFSVVKRDCTDCAATRVFVQGLILVSPRMYVLLIAVPSVTRNRRWIGLFIVMLIGMSDVVNGGRRLIVASSATKWRLRRLAEPNIAGCGGLVITAGLAVRRVRGALLFEFLNCNLGLVVRWVSPHLLISKDILVWHFWNC